MTAPRHVQLLPFPGFALMSWAALTEPMRAANLLAGRPVFAVAVLAGQGGAVASSGGAEVRAAPLREAGAADIVLAVAGGDPFAIADPAALAHLRAAARAGALVGGVSGGPVVLARAGLLDGYRATVHWEHAPRLAQAHPRIALERSLYVIDRNRASCAGGTAPMDMMLALIAEAEGAAFARAVADWFIHAEIRPPSGPQRAGLAERLGTRAPPVLAAVAAMEHHLADPLPLEALARRAGVGPRQLARLFAAELGIAPMAFYRRLRLQAAAAMLRDSALPVTEIALATGFAGSAHFAAAFRAATGTTPRRYRQAAAARRAARADGQMK